MKRWSSTTRVAALGEDESSIQGTGCNFCTHTGYKDRIGVYELLIMTPELRRLVVGWATQEELRNMAVKQGMRTLRQEAINLVNQDITSISEVIRSVYTL
jgi:type IV pilus assembly protein PilB